MIALSELNLDTLTFDAARSSDADALDALFERADVPCHCRYWHFTGDKNAWLDRCFHTPAENAREFRSDLEAAATLSGVVARDVEGKIWGWLKLTTAERVDKLYQQRLYRNLPCFSGDRTGTYTVGCFLVDPEARQRGIATALLARGVELCRTAGARQIEAFPRRGEYLGAPELWLGPYSLFERCGFHVVNDFAPYPVLRLEL